MDIIYLDYAATTPLSKSVKNTILKSINNDHNIFFNSGSKVYPQAEIVHNEIEKARAEIAQTLKVLPREIIFTSGATESNNIAIKGVAYAYKNKGKHIITSKVEHKAVLDVCGFLEKENFDITYLDVNQFGEINLKQFKESITPETILVSLMAVNNELGTINNLIEIGKITNQNKILLHVDAAQGYGKIDINIKKMNIDLLSVSGHKLYAPKGIGFLYLKSKYPKIKIEKQTHGGAQEFNLRAGTLATYQIFSLSIATKEIFSNIEKNFKHVLYMRQIFLDNIKELIDFKINTNIKNSYPGIISITFLKVKSETLLALLNGICISVGSACNSQLIEISHVLSAIGLTIDEAESTFRISFGQNTTKEEVISASNLFKEKIQLLRFLYPIGENNICTTN